MKSVARYMFANFFNYEQTTPDTIWLVQHNLGRTPIVEVLINNPESGNLEKAIPKEIVVLTENLVRIVFSTALTGRVRVIA